MIALGSIYPQELVSVFCLLKCFNTIVTHTHTHLTTAAAPRPVCVDSTLHNPSQSGLSEAKTRPSTEQTSGHFHISIFVSENPLLWIFIWLAVHIGVCGSEQLLSIIELIGYHHKAGAGGGGDNGEGEAGT